MPKSEVIQWALAVGAALGGFIGGAFAALRGRARSLARVERELVEPTPPGSSPAQAHEEVPVRVMVSRALDSILTLSNRFEDGFRRMDERFTTLDRRGQGVSERLDRVQERVDGAMNQRAEMIDRIGGVEKSVKHVEKSVDDLKKTAGRKRTGPQDGEPE